MSPQMSCAWLAPPLAMVLDSGLVVRRAASESALCQWLILNSRFQVSRFTHGSLFPDRASSFFWYFRCNLLVFGRSPGNFWDFLMQLLALLYETPNWFVYSRRIILPFAMMSLNIRWFILPYYTKFSYIKTCGHRRVQIVVGVGSTCMRNRKIFLN